MYFDEEIHKRESVLKKETTMMKQSLMFFMLLSFSYPSFAVVNGDETDISVVPWQVSLQMAQGMFGGFRHVCGGTIVDETHILTAAHCVDFVQPMDLELGLYAVFAGGDGSKASLKALPAVSRILYNSNYALASDLVRGDVAVIELEEPIKFSETVQVADLDFGSTISTNHDESFGEDVFVSGWGRDETGQPSDVLKSGWMELSQCDGILCEGYRKNSQIFFVGEGVHIDSGDSGGPAMVFSDTSGDFQVVGIASYVEADRTKPVSVYTKISYFADWIFAATGYEELPRNAVEVSAAGINYWE